MALYPIVKESFNIYYDITEILGILIDRFMELEIPDSVKVYEIFCRVSKQFDELDIFYGWCKTMGIARSSEYPEVEKITQKKIDLMDEFIRDKSALAQSKRIKNPADQKKEISTEKQEVDEDQEVKEDMNAIKALPPPEGFEAPEELKPEPVREPNKDLKQEADLLNLGEDAMTCQQHEDNLALALFDGGVPPATVSATTTSAWEAFNDDGADWETALVESASHLSNQKNSLPGGFDMLMLDGMYQQGIMSNAMIAATGSGASGSKSSMVMVRPSMLALPAPPTSSGHKGGGINSDPFAASLAVAPPSYVQMSDMDKKQRLLTEEQVMWQQYARDGMQGQVGLSKIQQPQNYNMGMGGYVPRY